MTMRIKGPTEGAPPVDGPEAPGQARPVGAAKPTSTGEVKGTQRADALKGATAPDAVSEVARKLRAGEVTVQQAVDLLIEDAIGRQVGRSAAGTAELEGKLRELLRDYAATDPHLAAKIRRLAHAK